MILAGTFLLAIIGVTFHLGSSTVVMCGAAGPHAIRVQTVDE